MLVTLVLALGLNLVVFYYSQVYFLIIYVIISFTVGGYLLLQPAVKLSQTLRVSDAMALFNKASYYPPALLVIVLFKIII